MKKLLHPGRRLFSAFFILPSALLRDGVFIFGFGFVLPQRSQRAQSPEFQI
jgi:hypothetical protein